MKEDKGQNESRKLEGKEEIHLLKEPGKKWRIRSYECHQRLSANGMAFEYRQFLPPGWEGLEFDTAGEAEGFAQKEINAGKVPSNRQP